MDVPSCYRIEIRPGEPGFALSPEALLLALLQILQDAGLDFEVLADDSTLWTDPDDPERCVAVTLAIVARTPRPPARTQDAIEDVLQEWRQASSPAVISVTP